MKASAVPTALRTLGAAKENAAAASSLANAASWACTTARTVFSSAAVNGAACAVIAMHSSHSAAKRRERWRLRWRLRWCKVQTVMEGNLCGWMNARAEDTQCRGRWMYGLQELAARQ